MPRFISLMTKCIHHKISDCLIYKLHFNDLLLLLMKLDIEELRQSLKMLNSSTKKSNRNVDSISSEQAIKMLKGGV